MADYRRVYDSHVTCRLTAKNRDQRRNPTLGNRVWAISTFFYQIIPFGLEVNNFSRVVTQQCERGLYRPLVQLSGECLDDLPADWFWFFVFVWCDMSSDDSFSYRLVPRRVLSPCPPPSVASPTTSQHHVCTYEHLTTVLRCLTIMPKSRSTYDGRLI